MICPILATVGLITGLTAAWCWHRAIETAGSRAEKIAFVGIGQLYERATAWTATSIALSALCSIAGTSRAAKRRCCSGLSILYSLIAVLIADFSSAAGTVPTSSPLFPRMRMIRQLLNFLRTAGI
jgi:hypothetical protein